MNAKVIGEYIRKYRKERGMTQQQLADSLFVSAKTISRWELGNGLPDIEELPRIAALLNISIDRLVGNESSESKNEECEVEEKSLKKSNRKRMAIIFSSVVAFLIAATMTTLIVSDAFTPIYDEQTYVFEAEDGVFTSPFVIEKTENASGNAVVGWMHSAGSEIILSFSSEKAVEATLGLSVTRTFSFVFEDKFSLFVNGKKQVVGIVPGLGWDGNESTKFYNFGDPLTMSVPLKQGVNKIEIAVVDGLNVNFDKIELTSRSRLFSLKRRIVAQAENASFVNCRFSEFFSKNADGGKYISELIRPDDSLPGKMLFTVKSDERVYLPLDIYINRPYTAVFENKFRLTVNSQPVEVGREKGTYKDGDDINACFSVPYTVWVMLEKGENEICFSFDYTSENFDCIAFDTSANVSFVKKR